MTGEKTMNECRKCQKESVYKEYLCSLCYISHNAWLAAEISRKIRIGDHLSKDHKLEQAIDRSALVVVNRGMQS